MRSVRRRSSHIQQEGSPRKVRLFQIVEVADEDDRVSRWFDLAIMGLICANAVAFVAESVPAIADVAGRFFIYFEAFSVAVFTLEYLSRLWSCTADPRYRQPILGRLRFASRPLLVVDLLAIIPFYLPPLGVDLRSLRVLRLARIFRILKLARYSVAMQLMIEAIRDRKEELLITLGAQLVLLLFVGSALFYVENPVQPETFSSIPAAMWYGIATLSTVGYGDMYPITTVGRMLGGTAAILGIGMFALPAGVLGSAFTSAMQRRRDVERCPECGGRIRGAEDEAEAE